jgi:AraC-like DNA-binding protein
MIGTFGTGLSGETTDERHLTYRYGGLDREVHEKAQSGAARWLVMEDAPLLAKRGDEPFIMGKGWIAVTAVRSATRSIGVMYNDTAVSRRPINDAQQTRLAVYCSLVGALLDRHRDHEGEARSPLNQVVGVQPWVQEVVFALREDPSLDGRALAARAGVSEAHLNRQFRKVMAISLVDYRNRLRVEKFLGIVEGGQTNLHVAADAAGFGSYAQFHRVFRSTLGASPREYLTGQREEPEDG